MGETVEGVNQGNGAIDSLLHKHSFVVTASLNPS